MKILVFNVVFFAYFEYSPCSDREAHGSSLTQSNQVFSNDPKKRLTTHAPNLSARLSNGGHIVPALQLLAMLRIVKNNYRKPSPDI